MYWNKVCCTLYPNTLLCDIDICTNYQKLLPVLLVVYLHRELYLYCIGMYCKYMYCTPERMYCTANNRNDMLQGVICILNKNDVQL